MAKIGRPGLPDAERQRVWDLWKEGYGYSEISEQVGSPPGSIFSILLPKGGIYQPPAKRRAGTLTLAEREEISRGLSAGDSLRAIGRRLGRPASTISREIARNKGRAHYRAVEADDRSWRRASRPQTCKLANNPVLCSYVADCLAEDWSPEQIAGRLAKHHPASARVSHECIYQSLYIRSRGVLDKHLQQHLRTGRPMRRSRYHSGTGKWSSKIIEATPIDQRPAEANERRRPGHFEGDLVIGTKLSQIATIVDRATRYTKLVALDSRHAHVVTQALSREMNRLPAECLRSLTWDRGMELADHKTVAATTGMDVYFADPHSPWQRGTNENTNGLLRQYFPKKTSMSHYSQTDLDAIADKLNNRPRKTLNYDTPAERMSPVLH